MVSLVDRRPLVVITVCLLAGTLSGLVASEPPTVRGTVLGIDGSPVPGASVELRDPNDTTRADEPFVAVETDDNGRYSVKAPHAGVFRLVVTAPGRVAQERLLAPLVESRVLSPARLPDDAGLDVRVVRSDGSPVEGATIVSGARPTRTARFSTSPGEWTAARRTATTDEAGLARLPRAADESTRLAVVADGFAPAIVERVSGTATTVRMRSGSVRPVKVSDASGRAVASAVI